MNTIKIAVDFDGTVVDHRFPEVGPPVYYSVYVLQELVKQGHKLILNTMRSGEYLDAAVAWFKSNNIQLYGVNKDPDQSEWTSSPKVFAHMYIDDAAFCAPLLYERGFNRPFIDWKVIAEHFGISL